MLGGLIAGAIGGAAASIDSLADRILKEAEDEKKRAYELGILDWKLNREDEQIERRAELEQGNTVLNSQLADERLKIQLDAQQKENALNRKTNLEVAGINAGRVSPGDRPALELFEMKKRYTSMPEGPEKKLLGEQISFLQGPRDFKSSMLKDPITGESYPVQLNSDGTYSKMLERGRPDAVAPRANGGDPLSKAQRLLGWQDSLPKSGK